MPDGNRHLEVIVEILGRRHDLTNVDLESGTFNMSGDDQTIAVSLPLGMLDDYFTQLSQKEIPDLSIIEADARDRIKARYVTIWIDEMFESDLHHSLLDISLTKASDGRISLVDRRGPERRPLSLPDAEGGFWSSRRSDH